MHIAVNLHVISAALCYFIAYAECLVGTNDKSPQNDQVKETVLTNASRFEYDDDFSTTPPLIQRMLEYEDYYTLELARPVYLEYNQPVSQTFETYDYYWDTYDVRPIDFQQSFCSQRCTETGVKLDIKELDLDIDVDITNRSDCNSVRCFDCDCNKPRCELYGTCCPDKEEEFIDLPFTSHGVFTEHPLPYLNEHAPGRIFLEKRNSTHFDSAQGRIGTLCLDHGIPRVKVLVVRSCPRDFQDSFVRRMCEQAIPVEELTPEAVIRVTDTTNFAVFYNQFCAQCNGVDTVLL